MALAVLGGEGDGQRYDPHFTAFLPPTAQPSRCTPHPISHTAPRQFPVTPFLPSPHHLRPPTAVEGSPGWAKHDYPCTHSINAEKKASASPSGTFQNRRHDRTRTFQPVNDGEAQRAALPPKPALSPHAQCPASHPVPCSRPPATGQKRLRRGGSEVPAAGIHLRETGHITGQGC